MEGFKNTREGTNVAAQATAITLATVIKLHIEHSSLYCNLKQEKF
jgi:hypothetical protein